MIKLCNEKTCTQCFSCVYSCPKRCIKMVASEAGFKVPQVDYTLCIECKRCINSCHVLTPVEQIPSMNTVYAAWIRNKKTRAKSSSGGCFSAFAEYVLAHGGYVYGAAYETSLQVAHIGVNSLADLDKLRGSKYVQSSLNNIYSEVGDKLRNNIMVLFVGTPCQVAGLYAFLKKEYENLYTCDLICHGVPSQQSFDIYIKKVLPIDPQLIEKFNFRYCEGWGFEMSYRTADKKRKLPIKDSYYLTAFNRGYMFMEACYACRYASPDRVADITLGDFWDIGQYAPFHYEKKKGVSLLKVNSKKGNRLLTNVIDKLFVVERNLDEAIKGNYNLAYPSTRPLERDSYYSDSRSMSTKELVRKYKMAPSNRDYLRKIKRMLQKLF